MHLTRLTPLRPCLQLQPVKARLCMSIYCICRHLHTTTGSGVWIGFSFIYNSFVLVELLYLPKGSGGLVVGFCSMDSWASTSLLFLAAVLHSNRNATIYMLHLLGTAVEYYCYFIIRKKCTKWNEYFNINYVFHETILILYTSCVLSHIICIYWACMHSMYE